ncbi:hypothetical protein ACFL6I_26830 [candidate division KSB1 bacterium]
MTTSNTTTLDEKKNPATTLMLVLMTTFLLSFYFTILLSSQPITPTFFIEGGEVKFCAMVAGTSLVLYSATLARWIINEIKKPN